MSPGAGPGRAVTERPAAFFLRPPAEMRPIASVIGAEAALRLVEAHGGVRIKVPSQARPRSALAGTIGAEALGQLVRAFGGNYLNVPLCRPWRVRVLRLRDGMSYSEIARALHMTEGTVYRYLAAAELIGQTRLPGL